MDDATIRRWVSSAGSNNYARDRLSLARTFLQWLSQHDAEVSPLNEDLARSLRAAHPRLYGKQQQTYPPRFLTADEAERLLDACKDGTWVGSRDQLTIRLGLLGIRVTELIGLTWGNLHADGTLHWIGKKRRPRSATPGPILNDLLARWKRQYEKALARPVLPTDPIICGRPKRSTGPHDCITWGRRIPDRTPVAKLLLRRAAVAGLGHIAPHDLRRSCAAILHRSRSTDGGHLYDLLDIQQVLDHADPATTMRSYLGQIDDATKAAAGRTLDF